MDIEQALRELLGEEIEVLEVTDEAPPPPPLPDEPFELPLFEPLEVDLPPELRPDPPPRAASRP